MKCALLFFTFLTVETAETHCAKHKLGGGGTLTLIAVFSFPTSQTYPLPGEVAGVVAEGVVAWPAVL